MNRLHASNNALGCHFLCPGKKRFFLYLPVAQQRVMPCVATTLKMGGTSAVLSRSYNTSPASQVMRVSATQITRELLRTKGVPGLYRGLGATLMRWDGIKYLLLFTWLSIFGHRPANVLNLISLFVAFSGTSRSPLCTSLFLHICTSSASVHLKTHLCPSIGPSCLAAWLDPLLLWLSALVTVSDWSMSGGLGTDYQFYFQLKTKVVS